MDVAEQYCVEEGIEDIKFICSIALHRCGGTTRVQWNHAHPSLAVGATAAEPLGQLHRGCQYAALPHVLRLFLKGLINRCQICFFYRLAPRRRQLRGVGGSHRPSLAIISDDDGRASAPVCRFIRPDEFRHICGKRLFDKYYPQGRMFNFNAVDEEHAKYLGKTRHDEDVLVCK